MLTIWFASTNLGKITELKYLLPNYEIKSILDLPEVIDIAETGATFEENALIKAQFLSSLLPGELILADDSGICIDGLGGFPGIYSARWASPETDWVKIVDKLLTKMHLAGLNSKQQRSAFFQSTLVFIDPTQQICQFFTGKIIGSIAFAQKGTNGFAYDTVFMPITSSKTYAQMEFEEKQNSSHRVESIKLLNEFLSRNY
ncbi:dITP/XTP pyrophosphatase [Spiroplasma clarkii]|uniref:dITP/XTP pyrophosphatase n=1 Tax=Spiroplasma clarkii TaxID=2139 RepID=A0A1Y0L0Y4_9MOLU|nr:RdgB/HAM1 family non-canonical purine NTP pyrophosphatase [Spiroplasma clarkii]ARU91672.1 dITP/XTP pyrophosphatase [Spiroplasma clarkii]ATX71062.1 dITP/XTP pyrophosphatase [Spiroplasma clarkii]